MTTSTRPRGIGTRTAHDPGDPLVTSHCPFCGSGSVVGRSDGTIGCDFCGQAYIVRVQPAFPGMPQMPNGPGAPSDVGPDGGLVDPGMVGPDGMPMDDGDGPPPGDEDAEGEDGPSGAPDDSGGGAPPSGDSKENGNPFGGGGGGKGKSAPKKDKKTSARRYRGMQGQVLSEEQFLRHIAVIASGRDPRVLAALRKDAARHKPRTAMDDPAAFHHRTLPTGHRVTIGVRPGGVWYGQISPPAPHTQQHYMHLGITDNPRAEIDRQLRRPEAQTFIQATTHAPLDPAPARQETPWYQRPGTGGVRDEWRPAIGSRRPFGRTAVRIEHNHGDMSPEHLRQHMRDRHGFLDSPDDPDWVIDEEHRNEHADAPLEHTHPDLDAEYDDAFDLGDRDWLNQRGFEASRRPFGGRRRPRATSR